MTTLLEASLKVFLLFLPLMGVQDLVRVLGAVQHSVDIRDADINDAASLAGQQPADQNIPLAFASVLVKVAFDWVVWVQFNHRFSRYGVCREMLRG